MENNTASVQQIEALRQFAAANGRTWKSSLRHCWEAGCYSNYSGTERSDLLQQVRNQFGPSWLVRFRLPDPQVKMAELPGDRYTSELEKMELTNGEGANIDSIIHFLRFMKDQSAPLPESSKEADHLLARYMKQIRREQMEFVDHLRASRGEAPLEWCYVCDRPSNDCACALDPNGPLPQSACMRGNNA